MLTKALLKSLLAFASKDDTRPHINCVHFNGTYAVATDGHALVRHDCVLPVCTITRESIERLVKIIPREGAELLPDMTCAGLPLATTDEVFPPHWDTCVPAVESYAEYKACAIGVNPRYLARLALVADACGAAGVRVLAGGDDWTPIRADCSGPLGAAVAVIMPMRL